MWSISRCIATTCERPQDTTRYSWVWNFCEYEHAASERGAGREKRKGSVRHNEMVTHRARKKDAQMNSEG